MSDEHNPYEEGKRAGLHPLLVLFGVILVMWLLINLAVPAASRNRPQDRKFPRWLPKIPMPPR